MMPFDSYPTELISAILGTVLGFTLGKLGDWWSQRAATRQKDASVRQLLALEQKRNRDGLEQYWNTVYSRRKMWTNEGGEFLWVALAREIIAVPLPNFSKLCWQSNLEHVASAYAEHELHTIWDNYERLIAIQGLREHLALLEQSSVESGRAAEALSSIHAGFISNIVSGIEFAEDGIALAKQIRELVTRHLGAEKFVHHDARSDASSELT